MWNGKNKVFRRKKVNRRLDEDRSSILMVSARLSVQQRERRHRIGAILLLAVVLAGTTWAVLSLGGAMERRLFSECDRFTIRHFDLSSDGKLRPPLIQEYARLEEGMNLFAVSPSAICEALQSVPVVRSVTVRRQLPDTLAIRIVERVCVARLEESGGRSWLGVDREGYVLGPSSIAPSLPAIRIKPGQGLRPGVRAGDPAIHDALALIEAGDSISLSQVVRIRTVDVRNPDRMEVCLAKGERVLLSRDNMDSKLKKLALILQTSSKKGLTLASIDMTLDRNFPGTPP